MISAIACSTNDNSYKYRHDGNRFREKESYKRAKRYKDTNFKKPFKNFIEIPGKEHVFISKYEVTKGEYDAFLEDIKQSHPGLYWTSQIDYEAWRDIPNYSSTIYNHMVKSYRHPGYDLRPVVNINYQSALNYCQWATLQIKKKDNKKNVIVRLPTEEEYDTIVSHYKIEINTDTLQVYHDYYGELNANLDYYFNNPVLDTIQSHPVIDGAFIGDYVFEYPQTHDGICSIIGNVSEIIGKDQVYGGNWNTLTDKLHEPLPYTYPDPRIGFRLVLEILN